MVWLAIVVLTTAFYLLEHWGNTQVSRLETFAGTADEMAAGATEGDGRRRLVISAIGLFGTLLLLRREGRRLELRSRLGWLLLGYLAWCGISILWSDDPALTLRRFSVLLFCYIGALGIARQVAMRELCLIALVVSAILIFSGVGTEIALGTFRPASAEYRFAGTLHPNGQGAYCAMMALAAASLARRAHRGQFFLWMLCSIGVVLLILTKSRTSCGAFLAALLVYGLLAVPLRKRIMAIAGLVWVASMLLLTSSLLVSDCANVALLGRQADADSLTGRVPLWMELVPHVQEHFLLGHGYMTFWNPERITSVSRIFQWTIPNGHCAYLDSLLDLGAIGAVLCLATVITSMGELRRRLVDGDYGYEFLFVLLVCRALNSVLESGLAEPTSFPPFILVCGLLHMGFCDGQEQAAAAEGTGQFI